MVPVMVAEPNGAGPAASPKPRKTRGPAQERGLIEVDLGGTVRGIFKNLADHLSPQPRVTLALHFDQGRYPILIQEKVV